MTHRVLLDTSSLAYRAFFSIPPTVLGRDGRPVNALHGYLDMVATLIRSRHPDDVVHNYDDVKAAADNGVYPRFFRAMLHRGIALAPSAYEVLFPSLAHTDVDIDVTIDAAADAASALRSSS